MHKIKCPICGSAHTKKNGKRNGSQTYKCQDCGYQFRNSHLPSDERIWHMYLDNKQTIAELAVMYGTSESTIKRRLSNITLSWNQPPLCGSGYVHLDATYWGHNWGVIVGLDSETGKPLYLEFIKNETNADYIAAVCSIESRGHIIKGLILDGKQSLLSIFSDYNIQMCQFHMKEIIRRKLSNNPRLKAACALKELMDTLTTATKDEFGNAFNAWKEE